MSYCVKCETHTAAFAQLFLAAESNGFHSTWVWPFIGHSLNLGGYNCGMDPDKSGLGQEGTTD